MFRIINKFFGLIILTSITLPVLAMQDTDPDVEWYQSFFQEKKSLSIERALAQGEESIATAREGGDAEDAARALTEMGLLHLTRTYNYQLAMDYLIQALTLEDSLGLTTRRIFTYLAMAQVFEEVREYYKSFEFLTMAMEANRSVQSLQIRALGLNELGKVNASSGRIEDAFENYQQVLALRDDINKPDVEAEALFNLGHLFTLQGKYKEALDNHKRALALRRAIRDRKNEALSLNDIGKLYELMKNKEKAMANHLVALEIRQELKDKRGLAESYNNIGVLYYNQKNYQRAAANIQLALQAAQESQTQNQIMKSYEYLSACFEKAGDYKKALEYKDLFFAINNLIEGDKYEQSLIETQTRYFISQKENQIKRLELVRIQRENELREEKRFRNFFIVLAGLCLVIAGLIFYYYRQQQRLNSLLTAEQAKVTSQNIELQELNATKDKFFSIISHDLKGPLNSLTSFSSLLINHTEHLSKEEIRMFAKDFDKSLKNLFSLLENLLEWSRSQTGNIEFTPEPFDLGALLEENKELLKGQAQNKKITLMNESSEEVIISAHKNSVNTVVRNLIANAIKFTPEEGKITVNLARGTNDVVVSVTDTGVGMSQDVINKLFRIDAKHSTKGTANEKGTGLGLILCKEFIEKNGGRIWVRSTEGVGSVFSFSLPMS